MLISHIDGEARVVASWSRSVVSRCFEGSVAVEGEGLFVCFCFLETCVHGHEGSLRLGGLVVKWGLDDDEAFLQVPLRG